MTQKKKRKTKQKGGRRFLLRDVNRGAMFSHTKHTQTHVHRERRGERRRREEKKKEKRKKNTGKRRQIKLEGLKVSNPYSSLILKLIKGILI